MPKPPNSGGMSPLARLLRRRQDEGLSFGEMARMATRAGLDLSDSRISQIANDQSAGRLPPETIKALAKVLGVAPARIAELDDARFGLARSEELSPVASGIDPDLAATLQDLDPAEVQRVIDFARGIQSGR